MSAKFTPGPWRAEPWYHEQTGQGGWHFSAGGYRLPLCDMEADPAKEYEPEANARLIAAAPELLEALILMVRTHDEPADSLLQEAREQQWLAQARAAIAKATGGEA